MTSTDRLIEMQGEIQDAAAAKGISLKLLGGLGIAVSSPTEDRALERGFADIDLLSRRSESLDVRALFEELGYGMDPSSALTVHRRQTWWPESGDTHVDVFLGEFEMCHTLDLEPRLDVTPAALPAADLLLSKLQIVELNEKDVIDVARLLSTHELGDDDSPGTINLPYICGLLGADWGFYTTVTDNLEALAGAGPVSAAGDTATIEDRRRRLLDALEAASKTRGFRMRGRIGRKKRWYQLPEEVIDDM